MAENPTKQCIICIFSPFRRGQASIELLSYIGVFMLLVSASLTYFYPEWSSKNKIGTAELTLTKIKNTAEAVYGLGPGNRQTIMVNIPSDVIGTSAQDNRMVMKLLLPSGETTDVVQDTKAPLKGHIPKSSGFHKIKIEYTDSGVLSVGQGLSMYPSFKQTNLSNQNSTGYTLTIENIAQEDISNINLQVEGQTPTWYQINETLFDLARGENKSVWVNITSPSDVVAASYTSYIQARSQQAYAESTSEVQITGEVCGDGQVAGAEQCDGQTPFTLPDEDNPSCPNPQTGAVCDIANARYKGYDSFGICQADCLCQQDSPDWIECSTGCSDPSYCLNCAHCLDGVRNCGETQVDGGGACPVCDGSDDLAEGFECSLGDVQSCGLSGCEGTKTCISKSSSCGWSPCSSYQMKCQGTRCCQCLGSPSNPQVSYNGSDQMSQQDCTQNVTLCGDAQTCSGGSYGMICSALDTCTADLTQSLHPLIPNPGVCLGQECQDDLLSCTDDVFPCSGVKTTCVCKDDGTKNISSISDVSACSGLSQCASPSEIILHKMDHGEPDCTDAPSSFRGFMGGFSSYNPSCQTSSAYHSFTNIHYTDPGVYAPYQNGTLSYYGKAQWEQDDGSHHGWNACGFHCGCDIRIGTDEDNFLEWGIPCPTTRSWRLYEKSLLDPPTNRGGTIDWNHIGYIRFRFGAIQQICFQCTGCFGMIDYVRLRR